jgi:hypothetical protein
MTQTSGTTRDLLRDDRGVIMITGVMFTFLWIGLCWFIFGIGNAIAYRENLQNAADAGAFAAAVYDARGMNILAMINIVMGIALAVLVAAKIIQVVLFGVMSGLCQAAVASCADWLVGAPICIGAIADPECYEDCTTVDNVISPLKSLDSAIHDVLEVCHYLEVGIAVGWPWVAAGKSTAAGDYYGKSVPLVTSFSYSQIPYGADTEVSSLTDNLVNFSGSSTTDTGDTETRYGLPVASDKYSNLCTVAVIDVGSLGGLASGAVPSFFAGLLSNFDEWLCDAGADKNFWSEAIYEPVIGGGDWAFPIVTPVGIPLTCALVKGNTNELPMSGPDIPDSKTTYSPMKLYDKATMGLDYFGVWSTAIGSFKDNGVNRIQIAGQQARTGTKVVSKVPYDTPLGVTRAEFYYDPKTDETSSSAQTDEITIDTSDIPMHNVMWNMRWRARLRRYHYFPGILGIGDQALGAVEALMSSNITKVLTTAATDALNGESAGDIINDMLGTTETDVSKQNNTPAPKIYH